MAYLINPRARWFDKQDPLKPLAGGKVYFYEPGGLTLKSAYSDKALTTPITNPMILDSEGYPTVDTVEPTQVWGDGEYRIIVTDANDVEQYDDTLVFNGQSGVIFEDVDSITDLRDLSITPENENYFFVVRNDSETEDGGDNKLFVWDSLNTDPDNPPYVVVPSGGGSLGRFISYNKNDLYSTGRGWPVTGTTKKPSFLCELGLGSELTDEYVLEGSDFIQNRLGKLSAQVMSRDSSSSQYDEFLFGGHLTLLESPDVLIDNLSNPIEDATADTIMRTAMCVNPANNDIFVGYCRFNGLPSTNSGRVGVTHYVWNSGDGAYEPGINTEASTVIEISANISHMLWNPNTNKIVMIVQNCDDLQTTQTITTALVHSFDPSVPSLTETDDISDFGQSNVKQIASLSFLPSSTDIVALGYTNISGTPNQSYVSTDGGLTFTQQSTSGLISGTVEPMTRQVYSRSSESPRTLFYFNRSPAALYSGNLYQGFSAGSIQSTSDGINFVTANTLPANDICGIVTNSEGMWAGTDNGVYFSDDGFATFSKVPGEISGRCIELIVVEDVVHVVNGDDWTPTANVFGEGVFLRYVDKIINGSLESFGVFTCYFDNVGPYGNGYPESIPVLPAAFAAVPGDSGLYITVGVSKITETLPSEVGYVPYLGKIEES